MCYLVLKEQFLQDLVAIEKRSHLVPSRTQKLSSLSADIAKSCLVKYARRQLETHCNGEFFYYFCHICILACIRLLDFLCYLIKFVNYNTKSKKEEGISL